MHTAQELRDLNYHPYCFEKIMYTRIIEHQKWWLVVAAAAEAASVLFTVSVYNNIIFVSLYNFSSRNLQGVQLIKYMSMMF